MRRRRITAAELMAELESNPQWSAKKQERDEALRARALELAAVAAPLMDSLRMIGAPVKESVWDLVNTRANYDFALPVLMEHLSRDYPDEILEGIARAMAVRRAAPFRPQLIQLLYANRGHHRGICDGLAVAIAASTSPANVMETLTLARDRSLGRVRVLLLRPLRRFRNPLIRQAIAELSRDPDLAKEIGSWPNFRRPALSEARH